MTTPRFATPTLQGILFMTAAMFCFAVMNTFIRHLSAEMNSFFMVFMRNLIALCLMIPWLLRHGVSSLKTSRLMGHFWRAGAGIIAMELWFFSLSLMPVGQATALSFTTPIFVTIAAILFLNEKAGIRRWAAIIVSFMGVLIIVRPGWGIPAHGALVVLTSSAMMALASIVVKTLSRTEEPGVIVFYMSLFLTLFSLPPALPYFAPVTGHQLFMLFFIALFSTIAHFLMIRAYRYADMVVLMPFDFTRLLFTSTLAYFMLEEILDFWTVIGALLIVASSVYIAYRETRYPQSTAVLDSKRNLGNTDLT